LLQWCAKGQRAGLGVRIHCSHTHEEIGEYIGVSRETITRNLTDFKNLELVEQHGAVFFIPSLGALEIYAGQIGC
jgi:CRP-like cAMP-binding protein